MKGISAVVAVILLLVITIAMAGTAYMYFSRIMSARVSKAIELLDSFCTNTGYITLVIQNMGTSDITSGELKFLVDGSSEEFSCDPATIDPGSSTICTSSTAYSGIHSVRVVGPSNVISGPVNCP